MIQFGIAIVVFFVVNWLVWLVVEKKGWVPACLRYKPFICRICATFWTLAAISVACMVQGWWISGSVIGVLAVLNAFAMKYHEVMNTEEL